MGIHPENESESNLANGVVIREDVMKDGTYQVPSICRGTPKGGAPPMMDSPLTLMRLLTWFKLANPMCYVAFTYTFTSFYLTV